MDHNVRRVRSGQCLKLPFLKCRTQACLKTNASSLLDILMKLTGCVQSRLTMQLLQTVWTMFDLLDSNIGSTGHQTLVNSVKSINQSNVQSDRLRRLLSHIKLLHLMCRKVRGCSACVKMAYWTEQFRGMMCGGSIRSGRNAPLWFQPENINTVVNQ